MTNSAFSWGDQPADIRATHSGYSNGALIHRKPEALRHDPSKYRTKPYKAPTASQMIVLAGSISTDTRPPADKRSAMRKAAI